MAFVVEKQLKMQHYVNLLETWHMEDVQRLKG